MSIYVYYNLIPQSLKLKHISLLTICTPSKNKKKQKYSYKKGFMNYQFLFSVLLMYLGCNSSTTVLGMDEVDVGIQVCISYPFISNIVAHPYPFA